MIYDNDENRAKKDGKERWERKKEDDTDENRANALDGNERKKMILMKIELIHSMGKKGHDNYENRANVFDRGKRRNWIMLKSQCNTEENERMQSLCK